MKGVIPRQIIDFQSRVGAPGESQHVDRVVLAYAGPTTVDAMAESLLEDDEFRDMVSDELAGDMGSAAYRMHR